MQIEVTLHSSARFYSMYNLKPPKPLALCTALAFSFQRRRLSVLPKTHSFIQGRGKSMEETDIETVKFNKRRAEGNDWNDRPKKNLQRKVRKLNPISTVSYVQILGNGMDTQDVAPSVLLFFDKQRFIFNAGEGLQRFCHEHMIKFSKIDHIFLSRVCSETAGGLPGLLLALDELEMSVNVWGPSDIKYFKHAISRFIKKDALVHTNSFEPTLGSVGDPMADQAEFREPIVVVDDEVVKISAILLQPIFTKRTQLPQLLDEVIITQNPKEKVLDHQKPGGTSVIYVCELPEIKGKFDPEKAMALGLKPGPKYRGLQLGKSVKSDCQNITVHPSAVMGPSIPGPIVFLVDCPTESHFQELLSKQCLSCYYADFSGQPTDAKIVTCVIHLGCASLTSSPKYQSWMKRFGSAQHIMAGHDRKNVEIPILRSSARMADQLNYLCPQLFPAPGLLSLQHLDCLESQSTGSTEDSDSKVCERISAENLLKFTLRPYARLGLDRSVIPSKVASSETIKELLLEIPEVVDASQCVRRQFAETNEEISLTEDEKVMVEEPRSNEDTLPSCLENIKRDDLEIVLLGTGSSQPSKYRNVTSIHLNLFSKGGFLIDCGEGTLGQLRRRYGLEGADDAVRGLKCIWISHLHVDHHIGLARILTLRRDLLNGVPHEPLLVVGPLGLESFLLAFQRLEDLDMQFLYCKDTTEESLHAFEGDTKPKKNWEIVKRLQKVLTEAGLDALISFHVIHRNIEAFGLVLKASERLNSVGKVSPGWKIVYSGDTRPCPKLTGAARDATVLIHEATFEDDMVEDAVKKGHSTIREAIDVGKSARVYRTILTHFSQRYPKTAVFDEAYMHKACIGFDLMSINIADLPVLPKVLPYLKLLFRDEMTVDESDGLIDDASEEVMPLDTNVPTSLL